MPEKAAAPFARLALWLCGQVQPPEQGHWPTETKWHAKPKYSPSGLSQERMADPLL